MSLGTFDERAPLTGFITFTSADGTAGKALASGANNNIRVDAIIARSDDTVDRVVHLRAFTDNGDIFYSVTVPAGAGCGTVPAVNLLADFPSGPVSGVLWALGDTVYASLAVAVAEGKTLALLVQGGTL